MKRINFDVLFKVLVLICIIYALFLLTVIANSSDNGRYQIYDNETALFLDTKTGAIYYFYDDSDSSKKNPLLISKPIKR